MSHSSWLLPDTQEGNYKDIYTFKVNKKQLSITLVLLTSAIKIAAFFILFEYEHIHFQNSMCRYIPEGFSILIVVQRYKGRGNKGSSVAT